MRLAGTISEQRQARRFADYLLTQGIAARLGPSREGWTVWVIEEEALPWARDELASFRREPGAARFAVSREAERIRAESRATASRREVVAAALPPAPTPAMPWSLSSPTPLTWALLVLCGVVALMTRLGDPDAPLLARLVIAGAGDAGSFAPALREPWRWVTPVLLHSGPLHLLFVAVAWPELARRVEARAGTAALAAMVLGFGIFGNVVQNMFYGPACIGLSTPAFGLLGFAAGEGGRGAREAEVVLAAAWLGACLLGLVGPVGGAAHVAALAAGLGVGAVTRRLRGRRRVA
ncbi:rhomboid family intramembrane serine protease [Nannocystis radixulma]|uniref:Rhomboid family intramembrane serine protease n=1 Tax=Nannocystis radixulma TaxID=2995305 RepID=A0ABT5BLJ6_9BACT|nr:rhomboid family intramembrane serine protease [Nannocystis radixulma]MDC0675031.1 rhomboid family intramembrane serine protease [Nannocystis radixulma]